ncbi:unnamed protein product [Closterium sp. Naga37s-1]|nr:unnamed protein product [Closterium sp. Naga37s-1]
MLLPGAHVPGFLRHVCKLLFLHPPADRLRRRHARAQAPHRPCAPPPEEERAHQVRAARHLQPTGRQGTSARASSVPAEVLASIEAPHKAAMVVPCSQHRPPPRPTRRELPPMLPATRDARGPQAEEDLPSFSLAGRQVVGRPLAQSPPPCPLLPLSHVPIPSSSERAAGAEAGFGESSHFFHFGVKSPIAFPFSFPLPLLSPATRNSFSSSHAISPTHCIATAPSLPFCDAALSAPVTKPQRQWGVVLAAGHFREIVAMWPLSS